MPHPKMAFTIQCKKLPSRVPDLGDPRNRGFLLEGIVSQLEGFILRQSPVLAEHAFKMERNKIICVEGVHHEIDLYVTVDAAEGYTSIHIFECKNWKRPVGKNEIVEFAEKIRAVQAARGTIVARGFTSDATAQARKEPRIGLLKMKELEVQKGEVGTNPMTMIDINHVDFDCKKWNDELWNSTVGPAPESAGRLPVLFRGQHTTLEPFIRVMAQDSCEQLGPSGTFKDLVDGWYRCLLTLEKTYRTRRELVIGGLPIKSIRVKVTLTLQTARGPLWNFEIEDRGNVRFYDPVLTEEGRIAQTIVVSREKPPVGW